MFADAAAGFAEYADAVGLVDHQQRPVPRLISMKEGSRECLVLAVDASMMISTRRYWYGVGEQCVERGVVVVRERPSCAPDSISLQMLSWARLSWITRSASPSRCPITVTLVRGRRPEPRVLGAESSASSASSSR